ncbi:MAG: hypothetical protein WBA93_33980 [Microcoleaceae cyanobacterium]
MSGFSSKYLDRINSINFEVAGEACQLPPVSELHRFPDLLIETKGVF